MESSLCSCVLAKIEDQVGRVDRLASLVPPDRLDWTPPIPRAFSLGVLLGHLMDCLAGICAVLHASNPERLQHFLELKALGANQPLASAEARTRAALYLDHIREGFSLLQDGDLGRRIPTVFVPEGEPLLSLLLINFEHLASHKYQLFVYLRMLGRAVGSSDLYRFSGR